MIVLGAFLAGMVAAVGGAVIYFRHAGWHTVAPTKAEAVVQVTVFPGEIAFVKTKNVREWVVR